jgi:hypothetical protein
MSVYYVILNNCLRKYNLALKSDDGRYVIATENQMESTRQPDRIPANRGGIPQLRRSVLTAVDFAIAAA